MINFKVDVDGKVRLDKFLTGKDLGYSREFLKKLIGEGAVLVNGKKVKASFNLNGGDEIEIVIPEVKELGLKPKDGDVEIVFENEDLIVVNKRAGLVVHPGNGSSHIEDSLVNLLLFKLKGQLSGINGVSRPGIVHRLDKDTSGLLVVAKTDFAHHDLVEQFKRRSVDKFYYALVVGSFVVKKGRIEGAIARSVSNRKKMEVSNRIEAKEAVTEFEVIREIVLDGRVFSLVRCKLLTGRTHQIRVHFQSIGRPLVGDQTYGFGAVNSFFKFKFGLYRQFLHAYSLAFDNPRTKKRIEVAVELPVDLKFIESI